MLKPRLDTSTDEGLNAATVLAAFQLAGLDLAFKQVKVPNAVSLDFRWKDNARLRGSIFAEGTDITVSMFIADDAKAVFKHAARVDGVEARVVLGKEVQKMLRYMGFRGRKEIRSSI